MAPSIPCEEDKWREVEPQTVGFSKGARHQSCRVAGIRRGGRQQGRAVQARTDITGTPLHPLCCRTTDNNGLKFPPSVLPINATKAFERYQQHAELTGNATSQAMLGFFYSTGYGDVPVDQAQALLYYTFAAISGDQGAEMALGYRYWTGIGVSEDCMLALDWYESAAERCEPGQIPCRAFR